MKVALINMPFSCVTIPSHAIGILKSLMERMNVECDCFSFNLKLAEDIGLENYTPIGDAYSDGYTANWVFAKAAFCDDYIPFLSEYTKKALMKCGIVPSILSFHQKKCTKFLNDIVNQNWESYDLLGITVANAQINSSLAFSRLIKERFPNKKIILGGPAVFRDAGIEFLTKIPWIDYVCMGEGDRVFPELVKRLDNKQELSGMKGIVYRKDGKIVYELETEIIDLNDQPIPSYDYYLKQHKDNNIQFEGVLIEFSRGCWYGIKKCCTFCADVGISFSQSKPRTPQNALKYLTEVVNAYPNVEKFDLTDPLQQQGFVQNIFKPWTKIRPRKVRLFLETKPWLTRKDIKILANAGVESIQSGIETLHDKMLKSVKKGQTVAQCISCLKWCKCYGILPYWNYLYRIPGENPKWYYEAVDIMPKIYHLQPPIGASPVSVTKFSPYKLNQVDVELDNLRPTHSGEEIFPDFLDKEKISWVFDYDDEFYPRGRIFDTQPPHHQILFDRLKKWTDIKNLKDLKLDGDKVIDSRKEAEETYGLTDEERQLLLFCDAPQSKRKVQNNFKKQSLNKLMELDLVIFVSDRYLSLAEIADSDMETNILKEPMKIELPILI